MAVCVFLQGGLFLAAFKMPLWSSIVSHLSWLPNGEKFTELPDILLITLDLYLGQDRHQTGCIRDNKQILEKKFSRATQNSVVHFTLILNSQKSCTQEN